MCSSVRERLEKLVHIGWRVKEVIRLMLLQQCTGLPSPTHCDAVNATAASRFDVADGIAYHPGSLGHGGILRKSLADMVCLSAGLVTPEIGIDAVPEALRALVGFLLRLHDWR